MRLAKKIWGGGTRHADGEREIRFGGVEGNRKTLHKSIKDPKKGNYCRPGVSPPVLLRNPDRIQFVICHLKEKKKKGKSEHALATNSHTEKTREEITLRKKRKKKKHHLVGRKDATRELIFWGFLTREMGFVGDISTERIFRLHSRVANKASSGGK